MFTKPFPLPESTEWGTLNSYEGEPKSFAEAFTKLVNLAPTVVDERRLRYAVQYLLYFAEQEVDELYAKREEQRQKKAERNAARKSRGAKVPYLTPVEPEPVAEAEGACCGEDGCVCGANTGSTAGTTTFSFTPPTATSGYNETVTGTETVVVFSGNTTFETAAVQELTEMAQENGEYDGTEPSGTTDDEPGDGGGETDGAGIG